MTSSLRLVLDTNTVMALWHFRDPALAALARALDDPGRIVLCSRDDALEELRRVLAYPQFGLAAAIQAALLAGYRSRLAPPADVASAEHAGAALPQCRDGDDQKFLEIARDAGASHLLTRDKALLRLARHRLVRDRYLIQTPERFIAERLPAAC